MSSILNSTDRRAPVPKFNRFSGSLRGRTARTCRISSWFLRPTLSPRDQIKIQSSLVSDENVDLSACNGLIIGIRRSAILESDQPAHDFSYNRLALLQNKREETKSQLTACFIPDRISIVDALVGMAPVKCEGFVWCDDVWGIGRFTVVPCILHRSSGRTTPLRAAVRSDAVE